MKTDAGLIQDISHTDKTGTDLGRQTDTLCLTTGKRSGRPGQCQIFQSYIDQKTDPGFDLLEDLMSDHLLMRCQSQFIQKNLQLLNGKLRHLRDVFSSYRNCQSFFFQTLTAAGLTGGDPHKLLVLLLHGI